MNEAILNAPIAIRCEATKEQLNAIIEEIRDLQVRRLEIKKEKQDAQASLDSAQAAHRAAEGDRERVRSSFSDLSSLGGVKNAIKGVRQIVGVETEAERIQREMDRLSCAMKDIILQADLDGGDIDSRIKDLSLKAQDIYGNQLLCEVIEDVSERIKLASFLLRERLYPRPRVGARELDLRHFNIKMEPVVIAGCSQLHTIKDDFTQQLLNVATPMLNGVESPLEAKKLRDDIAGRRAAGYRA